MKILHLLNALVSLTYSYLAMASQDDLLSSDQSAILRQILTTVQSIQIDYAHLLTTVSAINERINLLTRVKHIDHAAQDDHAAQEEHFFPDDNVPTSPPSAVAYEDSTRVVADENNGNTNARHFPVSREPNSNTTSRIILTTYPGQSGVDPIAMNWGHTDPLKRGPVVVSRNKNTIRRRNGTVLHASCACTF